MRYVIIFMMMFFLSACFLKQSKPDLNGASSSLKYKGVVRLENFYGLVTEGIIEAYFEINNETTRYLMGTRGECELREYSVTNRKNRAINKNRTFVSLGKLFFGQSLQSSYGELIEQENHSYYLQISSDFPPGTYVVSSEKLGAIGYLSVPEELRDVEVNGNSFSSSTIIIRKNEPLSVKWKAPIVSNSNYIMIFDLEINYSEKKYLYRCLKKEDTISSISENRQWDIPSTALSSFQELTSGIAYFSRVLIYNYTKPTLNVQLQGLRTYVGLVQIFE